MLRWICLVMACFGCFSVQADEASETLQRANQLYEQQRYLEAAASYESLLEEGYQSAALHFNLGNAYVQLRKTAPAVLHYERALHLQPRDTAARHQLRLLEAHLNTPTTAPVWQYDPWWQWGRRLLSSNSWAVLSILLAWALLVLHRRNRFSWSFWVLLVVWVRLVSYAYVAFQSESRPETAIVWQASLAVKTLPSDELTTVEEVKEGTKIWLTETGEDWVKIRLPDGREGWVEANQLVVI